jgi:hypothetical protein
MTDNYEYARSSRAQNVDDYSPYIDKQANNYINDLNGGVYTNNSLSLVQFDLGQIYNSQKFTDTNDLYLVMPITIVAALASDAAGTLLAPTGAGLSSLCSIKTNNLNLIHQADLQIQGKTIEPTQPYINIAKHFKMMSEMSVNDLKQMGYTLGFGDEIDNFRSIKWNAASAVLNGNGLTNNRILGSQFTTGIGSDIQTTFGAQNLGCINRAASQKSGRCIDVSAGGLVSNNIVGTLITATQLGTDFKPTYQISGNYMIWYDYAVIKLNTLFESFGNIGLVHKLDATLRLWVNTGTVGVITTADGLTTGASADGTTLKHLWLVVFQHINLLQ